MGQPFCFQDNPNNNVLYYFMNSHLLNFLDWMIDCFEKPTDCCMYFQCFAFPLFTIVTVFERCCSLLQ